MNTSVCCFFFFKQKTTYEMRISDWISDVCSSYLVAQVVLIAENVGQHSEIVAFLDEAHGDARHRPLQRHARIHQRWRGAADGRHQRGTVGRGDLGDHSDGVGDVSLAGTSGRTESNDTLPFPHPRRSAPSRNA